MSHDDHFKQRICINCKMTLMEPHPEDRYRHKYLKCPTCGFTKEYKIQKYDYIKGCFIKDGSDKE